ncbi:hypothetical protein DFJ73DRAFT_296649 [Zopfochytrium polystomum]|nr:hypothetical protein DFJ73DRAFT_296649 [Zopfochytrium polystomum]
MPHDATANTTTTPNANPAAAAAASIAVASAFVAAHDSSNFRLHRAKDPTTSAADDDEDDAAFAAAAKSRLRALLHPSFVHVVLPSTLRNAPPPRNRDAYVDFIASTLRDAYASFSGRVRLMFASADGRYVEAKATATGVSRTGGKYRQEYCVCFEMAKDEDDGGTLKILRVEEFVDSASTDRFFAEEYRRLRAAAKEQKQKAAKL